MLTFNNSLSMLNLPLQKTEVGICTPIYPGVKTPVIRFLKPVFLCHSILVMVGCFGRLRSAEPGFGSANPEQPATQRFAPKGVGYFLTIQENRNG